MPMYHILLTCMLFYIVFFLLSAMCYKIAKDRKDLLLQLVNFMGVVIVWINAVDLIYFYMNFITFVPFKKTCAYPICYSCASLPLSKFGHSWRKCGVCIIELHKNSFDGDLKGRSAEAGGCFKGD